MAIETKEIIDYTDDEVTKYKARKTAYSDEPLIEAVQVEKETSYSVWIDGCRIAKRSNYDGYFDSFDEAKEFLIGFAEQKLNSAHRTLEHAQGFAGRIKGLKQK